MKRNIMVCTLLTAATMAGTGVWAGSGDGFGRPVRDNACRCSEQEERLVPPHSPEGRIDHMTRRLGLTNEQRTKIKAPIGKERETAGPLLTKLAGIRGRGAEFSSMNCFDAGSFRVVGLLPEKGCPPLSLLPDLHSHIRTEKKNGQGQ